MRPRSFAPRALVALLALGLFAGPGAPSAQAARKSAKEKAAATAPAATSGPVDLNTASEKQLEALPGIGASTAKKIIASRPYRTVADLGRAGVSAATQGKIAGMVTASGSSAGAAPATARMTTTTKTTTTSRAAAPAAAAAGGPVDLNSASEKQLEALPGVGAATAKKIIAGRPYGSTADLSKAGVSAATQKKIAGMVAVNGRAVSTPMSAPAATPAVARPTPARATPASPAVSSPPPSAPARATAPVASQSPPPVPGSGMVWVNIPSGVYHHEGDRWYGKTKSGKYMTEQAAIAAGYRAAHNEAKSSTK